MIDILGVKNTIPHRYPFLMVDRVLELVHGESAKGIKNVTINEPFFQGHFPDNPVMPGVLIIEALAQLSGILAFQSGVKGNTVYFMSIEKAKFRRPVVPGDQLVLDIKVTHKRGNVWRFAGKAMVEEAVASEAEFTAMVAQRE
ncbi:MAG: 3-hydroxyacyl-ACP dehydratase FabZ [Nitrospirae bacterium]|nr:3-hydroxyacyl-ACP dehydratase FabZ [Nitrospirota bacterium]MBF0591060.1 3-hydroxyacyl-ACP dehydratase FabZ [Nitrospirota bacterium]